MTSIFLKMEDDLNFLKMEKELNSFGNERRNHFLKTENEMKMKMKGDINFF
jgi:hypothetical protein